MNASSTIITIEFRNSPPKELNVNEVAPDNDGYYNAINNLIEETNYGFFQDINDLEDALNICRGDCERLARELDNLIKENNGHINSGEYSIIGVEA